MEPNSNPTVVGTFVIGFLLLLFVFGIWLSKASFKGDHHYYDIYFTGAITGLQEGSVVRYRGVPVGVVKQIELDPISIEKILVRIDIRKKITLKQDVYATLESQPLTGVSTVQLNGGTQNAPNLLAKDNFTYPEIQARSSFLDQVVDSVPAILSKVSSLTESARGFLTPENQEKIKNILKNIDSLTYQLSGEERLKKTIGSIETVSKKLSSTLDSIKQTSLDLSAMVKSSKNTVTDFNATGYRDLAKLVEESTQALTSIKRVGESLEKSPSRFLSNDPASTGIKLRVD